jgi:hypothetical protein
VRKVLDHPVHILEAVSPDERWIEGYAPLSATGPAAANQLFPLDNGPAISLGATMGWTWSRGGQTLAIFGAPMPRGRTYVVPFADTGTFLRLARGGVRSEEQIARLPGAHAVDAAWVEPGPTPDVYAFFRGTTQRNIYRLPVP